MTPSQRTTTDTHRPIREHLWTMPSGSGRSVVGGFVAQAGMWPKWPRWKSS